MKILLFNDNPVVRKLVALSAQKTKDDLSVVWSVEEIEESGYDLLIIDDALYSDETFQSLKEAVKYKATLLMATRGNAVPAGFDHVINKPFLPTDLVDLFAKIDKDLTSKTSEEVIDLATGIKPSNEEDMDGAINLEDTNLDFGSDKDEGFILHDTDDHTDNFEINDTFEELEGSHEEENFPAILDHEEVEEVRGLLEDTENELLEDEKISTPEVDDFDFNTLDLPQEKEIGDDLESFDFEGLDLDEAIEEDTPLPMAEIPLAPADESIEEEILGTMDLEDEKGSEEDELLLDDELMLDNSDVLSGNEAISDEALGALDLKIRQAIGDLEPDDLDRELGEEESFDFEGLDLEEETEEADAMSTAEVPVALSDELTDEEMLDAMDLADEEEPGEDELLLDDEMLDEDAFGTSEADNFEEEFEGIGEENLASGDAEMVDAFSETEEFEGLEGFDELDMLDERELKLAIGEEIDEESDIRVGGSEYASLSAEALDEAMELVSNVSAEPSNYSKETPAEGVEALQTLLKALANEDVVKSLKGLNISININFGNEK